MSFYFVSIALGSLHPQGAQRLFLLVRSFMVAVTHARHSASATGAATRALSLFLAADRANDDGSYDRHDHSRNNNGWPIHKNLFVLLIFQ